ncbi:MAG: hypothetical protein HOQ05_07715 [Corynebacteriales bacterium]|nr:hypothetical protein [Mycobacteriales bacterium]
MNSRSYVVVGTWNAREFLAEPQIGGRWINGSGNKAGRTPYPRRMTVAQARGVLKVHRRGSAPTCAACLHRHPCAQRRQAEDVLAEHHGARTRAMREWEAQAEHVPPILAMSTVFSDCASVAVLPRE